jgi:type IV pilus assembly protein PilZ
MDDRRVDPRAEVELEVHYRTRQEFMAAYSKNISGGGIFIRTQQPLPLNHKVLLRFTLPGIANRFEIHGVVVWANPASLKSSFPAGMGIKFMEYDPKAQQMLADFINQNRGAKPAGEQKPSSSGG